MRIKLMSVFVDDQELALNFYTNILGFEKKLDFPIGQFRWLTVVSPEEPNGAELLLEPSDNPAAKVFKKSLLEQGIAAVAFAVEDIHLEYERLIQQGVIFQMEPTEMGSTSAALFDDSCGNLVQIYQA